MSTFLITVYQVGNNIVFRNRSIKGQVSTFVRSDALNSLNDIVFVVFWVKWTTL